MLIQHVARVLGGSKVLRTEISDEFELIDAIRAGLPVQTIAVVTTFAKMSAAEVERIIPRRTLAHRRSRQQALSLEESNRLVRFARVLALAEETFQNLDKALTWLRKTNRALDDRLPIDLLDTDGGARFVEAALGRIAHGVFS